MGHSEENRRDELESKELILSKKSEKEGDDDDLVDTNIGTMVKEIFRSYKYYRSKTSNPTLEKPVLSSLANHTSYTTN